MSMTHALSAQATRRGYIFDRTNDLRTALIEARARRQCLALTLFSNGNVTPNWTKKGGGCRTGRIPPVRASLVTSEGEQESPIVETEAVEDSPLTPEERARVHPDDLQFLLDHPETDSPAPADDESPVVVVGPSSSDEPHDP